MWVCRPEGVGRRRAGRVGGEEQHPAGVRRVVAGGDGGAVGECASVVEVEDLAPAESVSEGALGDGPVAVVALHGHGRVIADRRGVAGGVVGAMRGRALRLKLGKETSRGRVAVAAVSLGDERRWWWRGAGVSGLDRGGEHEDASDEVCGDGLGAGHDGEVGCLPASGDRNGLDDERDREL